MKKIKGFILWVGGALDIAFTTFLCVRIVRYMFIEINEVYMLMYAAVLALWCISCSLGAIRESYEELRGKK